jgi:putative oxidoreductase
MNEISKRNIWATVAIWALRIVLALAFISGGLSKLTGAPAMVVIFTKIGFGDWFRYLTGVLEVLGAIGLVIPRTSFYAACLLGTVMVGAIGFHLTSLGGNPTPAVVMLLLAALSAWLSRPGKPIVTA